MSTREGWPNNDKPSGATNHVAKLFISGDDQKNCDMTTQCIINFPSLANASKKAPLKNIRRKKQEKTPEGKKPNNSDKH